MIYLSLGSNILGGSNKSKTISVDEQEQINKNNGKYIFTKSNFRNDGRTHLLTFFSGNITQLLFLFCLIWTHVSQRKQNKWTSKRKQS